MRYRDSLTAGNDSARTNAERGESRRAVEWNSVDHGHCLALELQPRSVERPGHQSAFSNEEYVAHRIFETRWQFIDPLDLFRPNRSRAERSTNRSPSRIALDAEKEVALAVR